MLRRLDSHAAFLLVVAGAAIFGVEIATAQTETDSVDEALPAGALVRLGTPRWRHATGVYFVAIMDQLVADLDSGDFRTRTQAAKELESLGESALSALKKAHVSASLEARRRIEPLLEKLTPNALTTEQVRLVRSVEVLERIGSAEARQVLGALANGAPDALLTRQAKGVLNRHSGQ